MEDRIRVPRSHFRADGRPKIRYPTRTIARRMARKATKAGKGSPTGRLGAYLCPTCSGYHVGGGTPQEPNETY